MCICLGSNFAAGSALWREAHCTAKNSFFWVRVSILLISESANASGFAAFAPAISIYRFISLVSRSGTMSWWRVCGVEAWLLHFRSLVNFSLLCKEQRLKPVQSRCLRALRAAIFYPNSAIVRRSVVRGNVSHTR